VLDTPPPAVHDESWIKTPVDRFVLAKLESQKLVPAPAADKLTLLRRVTFDLTGLPPTPEEVDAFLADESANAFEASVRPIPNCWTGSRRDSWTEAGASSRSTG